MENTKEIPTIDIYNKKLTSIEKQLEKVRGKEYGLPFGSMRRAKISRKWDMLAREKMYIIGKIEELSV